VKENWTQEDASRRSPASELEQDRNGTAALPFHSVVVDRLTLPLPNQSQGVGQGQGGGHGAGHGAAHGHGAAARTGYSEAAGTTVEVGQQG
jgi:hypothetical protein